VCVRERGLRKRVCVREDVLVCVIVCVRESECDRGCACDALCVRKCVKDKESM
jgi:hypothetical protein